MATVRHTRSDSRETPGILRPFSRPSDVMAFGVAAIVVVAAFGFLIAKTASMTHVDFTILKAVNPLHSGFLAGLGTGIYSIFSPVPAVLITVVIVAIIWFVTKNLRVAATFAVVVAVTWVPSDVVKILVHRHRPDAVALVHHLSSQPVDPSYPSGHMVFATALVMAVLFLARGKSYRTGLVAAGVLLIVIVAFALLSDAVHYPTDVAASIVWGVAVAPLVLLLWNRFVIPRTYRVPNSAETLA